MLVAFAVGILASVTNPRVDALRSARAAGRVVVSPSVAKCDLLRLGEECQSAVNGGAEWLHFSVQDGRMVPKVSIGSPIVAALREALPNTVFDVKLGCMEPERRVAEFAKAGADILSAHPESTLQFSAVVNEIQKAGCAPGAVLNPGTPLSAIDYVLDDLDVVVIMLVNPGWGGPKYLKEACRKIEVLRASCAARGLNPWIEVDGGVSTSNAGQLLGAGANALVAGGSVFSAANKREAIDALIRAPAIPEHSMGHST
eukprot:CAMPEP_0206042810 /NCGR_PEP_ID=MMETSP1466-20131121/6781_1 /ASSEMBLY_ACC=CAM_ASM_001126 /TAXON_ID=44452 /ORGANISM="Pavlova gyrans, Strain CCMP608" /LENGTH=256 /DNA_ID=CAMNT_0053417531 /DNA_START=30 /DNA_END=800 /DNA_ORIENTATION=+